MTVSMAAADLGEILSLASIELSSLNPIMGNNSVYIVTDGIFNGAIAFRLLGDELRSALIASSKVSFADGERSGLIWSSRGAERCLSLSELRLLRTGQAS